MLTLLLRALAQLPLFLFHFLGWGLGWVVWLLSPRLRRISRANLAGAGHGGTTAAWKSIGEAGKGVLELLPVWFRPQAAAAALVREVIGGELIDAARAAGRGIVFVTPHLGCFEVTAQWYAQHHGPMTALYAPPKSRLLRALVAAGRAKPPLRLASPDLRGIRALLRALRAGEAIGILPDQAPGRGEGEWAEFFGQPAYTMTLVQRLAQTSAAPILLAWAERLPAGRGYRLHVQTMPEVRPGESAARHLNRALEGLIGQCPAQYLWAYNRYKVPAGVAPPGAG